MNLFYQIMKYTNFFSLIITVILIGVFIKDMYYRKPETDEKTKKATDNLGITILSFLGIWFFSGVAYFILYYRHHRHSKAAAKEIADELKIKQGRADVNELLDNIDRQAEVAKAEKEREYAMTAPKEAIQMVEMNETLKGG
jgi:hypothetical protein